MIFPLSFKKSPSQGGQFDLITGVDTSFWNLLRWNPVTRKYEYKATWNPAETPDIQLHIRKATQADFQDPAYLQSLYCITHVRYNTCYHFLDPLVNVVQQANLFITKYKLGGYNLPGVLDVEWAFWYTRKELTSMVMQWLDIVDKALNCMNFVYTAPYFWNDHLENVYMGDRPLWIANYYVQQPMLPRGWRDWVIWQYTAKGKVPGLLGSVDMNYAKASKLAELEIYGVPPIDPAVPMYIVLAYALRIRCGPGVEYKEIGGLYQNDVRTVYAVVQDKYGNPWAKLSNLQDQWACIQYGSKVYMRQV